MAGFFFISDKTAKEFEFTSLSLFKFKSEIPPNGTKFF